jgi:hypothetical protein
MLDTSAALKDIDQVLAETPAYGGSGAVAEMASRLYACICRHAPVGSPHRKQAEAYISQHPGDFYNNTSQVLDGVLRVLRSDIAAGRTASYDELVHADIFIDLLAQAGYLLSESYRRAAAVLAGGTLEEHLRKMAAKAGISVVDPKNQPRPASALNADLYSAAGAYLKSEQAQVDAWQKVRNDAAHGKVNFEQQYTDPDVRRMCDGIRDFIAKYPA